jgi:hypothetical protein
MPRGEHRRVAHGERKPGGAPELPPEVGGGVVCGVSIGDQVLLGNDDALCERPKQVHVVGKGHLHGAMRHGGLRQPILERGGGQELHSGEALE